MAPLFVFPHSQRLLCPLAAAAMAAALPVWAQEAGGQEDKDLPVTIQAQQINGHPDREVALEHDVEITRGVTTVNADRATYHVVEDQIEAYGEIRMQRLGDRYTGDELKLKFDSGEGYVLNPTYYLERNHAQGEGDRIDFEAEDRAFITNGTYSTCEGPDPDWYLKTDTLHLDRGRDIGKASKTVIYFKGVPILGTPGMSFPLSDARHSGFLPPSIGSSSRGGLEITLPYYFNIAPNRDVTFYPNLIARRGALIGMDGRYLSQTYSGDTRVEFLLNDQQTKTNRYALTATHTQNVTPALSFGWNLNTASDDDYPNDFSRTITNSGQRLLLRDLNLNYSGATWNAAARLSNYQVLQDPAAPITRPYDRLPQLNFHVGRQDVGGMDWSMDAELTRFWHPDLLRGERFVFHPSVAYPIVQPGYFVTPRLSLDVTAYTLANPALGAPSGLNRTLPTLSIDSGLIFERDASFFGQETTQTLEPRLFYVRTPYRNQNQFPNFDTAEADLSFAQLFSENRFIGHDRISDANQLTVALVSRYIQPLGAERLRLALGQRFYFSEQRVNLTSADPTNHSDLLASVSGHLTDTLAAESNMQYNANLHRLNRANFGVRWQPAPKHVLNLQYRRDLLNNLEQVDASAQWPLATRWYGVGRLNYSIPDQKIAEGLVGVEYKADCWVFRSVVQRIPTATEKATTAFFFQLELAGLARLGINPLDALKTSIPGYQLINQP